MLPGGNGVSCSVYDMSPALDLYGCADSSHLMTVSWDLLDDLQYTLVDRDLSEVQIM